MLPKRTFQSVGLTLAAADAISTISPLICGSGTLSSQFQLLRSAVLMQHNCLYR
jgi:hypothetical protein